MSADDPTRREPNEAAPDPGDERAAPSRPERTRAPRKEPLLPSITPIALRNPLTIVEADPPDLDPTQRPTDPGESPDQRDTMPPPVPVDQYVRMMMSQVADEDERQVRLGAPRVPAWLRAESEIDALPNTKRGLGVHGRTTVTMPSDEGVTARPPQSTGEHEVVLRLPPESAPPPALDAAPEPASHEQLHAFDDEDTLEPERQTLLPAAGDDEDFDDNKTTDERPMPRLGAIADAPVGREESLELPLLDLDALEAAFGSGIGARSSSGARHEDVSPPPTSAEQGASAYARADEASHQLASADSCPPASVETGSLPPVSAELSSLPPVSGELVASSSSAPPARSAASDSSALVLDDLLGLDAASTPPPSGGTSPRSAPTSAPTSAPSSGARGVPWGFRSSDPGSSPIPRMSPDPATRIEVSSAPLSMPNAPESPRRISVPPPPSARRISAPPPNTKPSPFDRFGRGSAPPSVTPASSSGPTRPADVGFAARQPPVETRTSDPPASSPDAHVDLLDDPSFETSGGAPPAPSASFESPTPPDALHLSEPRMPTIDLRTAQTAPIRRSAPLIPAIDLLSELALVENPSSIPPAPTTTSPASEPAHLGEELDELNLEDVLDAPDSEDMFDVTRDAPHARGARSFTPPARAPIDALSSPFEPHSEPHPEPHPAHSEPHAAHPEPPLMPPPRPAAPPARRPEPPPPPVAERAAPPRAPAQPPPRRALTPAPQPAVRPSPARGVTPPARPGLAPAEPPPPAIRFDEEGDEVFDGMLERLDVRVPAGAHLIGPSTTPDQRANPRAAVAEPPDAKVASRRAPDPTPEELVEKYLARLGGKDKVPRTIIKPEELRWLSIDHRAGFLLSCIDGTMTVEEVLDVAGMQEFDALRILYELVEYGAIALDTRQRRPIRR